MLAKSSIVRKSYYLEKSYWRLRVKVIQGKNETVHSVKYFVYMYYIHIYLYIYVPISSLSLSLFLYIYITYIYKYINIYINIYCVYIFIYIIFYIQLTVNIFHELSANIKSYICKRLQFIKFHVGFPCN